MQVGWGFLQGDAAGDDTASTEAQNRDFHQGWPKVALEGGSPCPETFQLVKLEPTEAWLGQEADPLPWPQAKNWA